MYVQSDGATLAGVDGQGVLWRWSPTDAKPRQLGALPTGRPPTEIQFSPGGRELVAIDFGHNAVVQMSAESGETLRELTLRDPRDVEWSHDGAVAAIASLNDVVLLKPRLADPLVRVASHQGAANCVAWHPAGQYVASGGQDRVVLITDVARRQAVATLQGHRSGVTAAAFSPDGRCLATADVQGTIKLWHTATWQFLYDLTTTGEQCHKLSFSPAGDRLTAQFAQRVLVFGQRMDATSVARD
jgi:WD40 repeat protein